MPRYDRIPARIESSREGGNDGVDSSSCVEIARIPTDDGKSRFHNKILKRRGSLTVMSHKSSGSYASLESHDDQDFLNDPENDDNGETMQPSLHKQRSYASDDGLPSIIASYSGSFDLDDDDDDDALEANLKRYNLDFSSAATADKGASLSDGDGNPFARERNSNSNWCSRAARFLWFSFQSVRQQARQRRAQLLLQQTERNWRQSLKICLITNCDATDSGIMLVVAAIVGWILALVFLKDPTVRIAGIGVGILFFTIRVGTRPLYHCCLRRRQKRRLRRQQLEDTASPGMKVGQNDEQNHHHLARAEGTLELHAIRGDGNTANRLPSTPLGSDPTVAAI